LQGYDVGKTLVHRFSSVPSTGMTLPQYAAAGFFSAIPMTAITAPFERIKIVLQIQGQSSTPGQKQYTGGVDALRGIYKDGGFRSGTQPPPPQIKTLRCWEANVGGQYSVAVQRR
jgi:solute carrier family 25 (mitochondrial carnitine/acylcarnitine transporter), member 20/29